LRQALSESSTVLPGQAGMREIRPVMSPETPVATSPSTVLIPHL